MLIPRPATRDPRPAILENLGRRSPWFGYLPGFLGVMAVVLGGVAWAWFEFGSVRLAWLYASGVRVQIEPTVLKVGPPASGEAITRLEITALNLSNSPVRVLGADTTCSCLSAEGLPITVPARSRAILPVSMTREPENPSRVRVSLNYHTDHPNAPRLTLVVEE